MTDRTKPAETAAPPAAGKLPKVPLPTSDPGAREEWARWVEAVGSHFSALYVREMEYLRSHPDDKQSAEQAAYWRHAVGVVKWLAYRVRAGKLRPLGG